MTLTANEINCGIYRVSTRKIKEELGGKAKALKDKLLDRTYEYCINKLREINSSYSELETMLCQVPANERELEGLMKVTDEAPSIIKKNVLELKDVDKHFLMLDEFAYFYKELDI